MLLVETDCLFWVEVVNKREVVIVFDKWIMATLFEQVGGHDQL